MSSNHGEEGGSVPDAFANPVWNALHSTHAHLALRAGMACKYAPDVAPLSALAKNCTEAMTDLRSLLEPAESTYVIGAEPPGIAGLRVERGPVCLQMCFPPDRALPDEPSTAVVGRLSCADAPAMMALIEVAFPGFFRARTCVMGSYYGVWQDGVLAAMAGERLCPFPFREVSGVCTHPDHRGKGYAALLVAHVLADQRRANAVSALQVAATNARAIELYTRLGFVPVREVLFHRLTHVPQGSMPISLR